MKSWTPEAREELERTLIDHHARLVGTGADADEVVADLRRHVEAELNAATGSGIETGDVRAVVERVLGAPSGQTVASAGETGATRVAAPHATPPAVGFPGRVGMWMFLVMLPALTLAIELTTRMCALEFFDPIESLPKAVAVALVPLIFGCILGGYHQPWFQRHARRFLALGLVACAICAYFSVLFLPIAPFAVIGIAFMGFGLLPLSPLLALLFGLVLARQMSRAHPVRVGRRRRAWLAWPATFAALLAVDAGEIVTMVGLRWYAAPDSAIHARGLALLRSPWASVDGLRNRALSWNRPNLLSALFGDVVGGERWDQRDAERAFFEATGRTVEETNAFSDVQLRLGFRGRGRGDVSTAPESRRLLALTSSRLDGQVEADALVGYVEWTATLENSATWAMEGRAILNLPPGGVVSRVTLWVNGEEREAAFAGRAQATKAYETVAIVRRRDPILVTTAGPDRVRIRCFPVPSNGSMKFRLGITFPLAPAVDGRSATMALPRVAVANFRLDPEFEHQVWFDGATEWAVASDGLKREPAANDRRAVHGPVRDGQVGSLSLRVARDSTVTAVSGAAFAAERVIVQRVVRDERGPRAVVLVIDGSPLVWRDHQDLILEALPVDAAMPVRVWFALDEPVEMAITNPAAVRAELALGFAYRRLKLPDGRTVELPRRGGFDNSRALAAALSSVDGAGGTVIWIHSTQMDGAAGAAAVRQNLDRRAGGVELIDVSFGAGSMNVLEALDGRRDVRLLAPATSDHLASELAVAAGVTPRWLVQREEVARGEQPSGVRILESRQLARMWAAEQSTRVAARGPGFREAAIKLAASHQLVTSVTGAVVLETQQQYDEHGLTPVDPSTVPAIPDHPSVWVLLLGMVALVAAAWFARRRNRPARAISAV